MTRLKITDLALWPSYFLRTCTLETRAVSVHRLWWPLDSSMLCAAGSMTAYA